MFLSGGGVGAGGAGGPRDQRGSTYNEEAGEVILMLVWMEEGIY